LNDKSLIGLYKKDVELFQCSIISAVSTLIYSEYIRNIRDKTKPVRLILVPEIHAIEEILNEESQLMKSICSNLINHIINHRLYSYIDKSELIIFKHPDVLHTILEKYIAPTISQVISNTIRIKFGIGDSDQQLIFESNEIDLFNRTVITERLLEYVFDETVLYLIVDEPSIPKYITPIYNGTLTFIDEIIKINHRNAITPIYINIDIINNESVKELLSFVTSTEFISVKPVCEINTSISNEISVISLN
jgi:hypothetical protein